MCVVAARSVTRASSRRRRGRQHQAPGTVPAVLSVPVNPAPTDVQVTGSASTGSPPVGSDFSYTFQVKDNGPWPAPGVTFADTVPSTLGLIGVTSSLGTCSTVGSTVSCDFGDMAVGSQANVITEGQLVQRHKPPHASTLASLQRSPSCCAMQGHGRVYLLCQHRGAWHPRRQRRGVGRRRQVQESLVPVAAHIREDSR